MISKFGVMPDIAAGAIIVPSVEGWGCERPLTGFYPDNMHLPPKREFLRVLQDERLSQTRREPSSANKLLTMF